MSADLWVKPVGPDRLSEVWSEKAGSPVCASPGDFDFSWGGEDGVSFERHECLPPCGVAGAWPRCIHEMETHRQEADDRVFLVTQFEEQRTAADGTSESSFAFVPLEEAHSIGLRYSYSVPYPWWPGSFSASELQSKMPTFGELEARSDGLGPEGENILTVLLDSQERVHRVVEPDPLLGISLPELLEMAGDRGAMDAPNVNAGPNSHAGTQNPEGGLGRITGMNIDIKIECVQSQVKPLPGRELWAGPVCYAKVAKNPTKPWAAWESVEALGDGGTMRRRLHHGVRARVVMEGHVDVFDANSLFLQLTASLVFLALPRQFMYFFINYTLGHLSTIYRGVIIELFDVQMECARLTARLMSNSVTFVELEDVKPEAKSGGDARIPSKLSVETNEDPIKRSVSTNSERAKVGCISRRRVEEQLRKVLRYRGATLDEAEIAGVVHFCHEAVMHSETLCRRARPLHDMQAAVIDRFSNRRTAITPCEAAGIDTEALEGGVITIDAFSMCCAATSQLEFESFVRLFDKDRGVKILEKLFLPPKLKPKTLLLEGQKCLKTTAESKGWLKRHGRSGSKMDLLRNLQLPTPAPPAQKRPRADLRPISPDDSVQAPPGTSPVLDIQVTGESPQLLVVSENGSGQELIAPLSMAPRAAVSPLRFLGGDTPPARVACSPIRAVDFEEESDTA